MKLFFKQNIILILIIFLAIFLRLYYLGQVPPALNWDETSLGYNAYSILKTAKDEHGKFLPLTNFAAFGDYKPPLYIYATVPILSILPLSEFAVRFPSAFFGILTVFLIYLIAGIIFGSRKIIISKYFSINIPLLSAFFLAISPWHLQFSRGAFEANLGLFFSTLGIYLFFMYGKGNKLWLFPSLFSFTAGMYTFTGQRLFAPIIIFLLFWIFRRKTVKSLKIVIPALIVVAIIFFPLYQFATQTIEGRLRFEEVTIFRNLEPINKSIEYRQQDNFGIWANIFHNRRLFRFKEYLSHYFDAFNPQFLFIKGDVNPRLSLQDIGELYLFELPLILSGIYFLFKSKEKYRYFIISWLLVSPLGPATARETPHALRMIHILPVFPLLSAYGLYKLITLIKFKRIFLLLSALIIFISFIYYLHSYYVHYPLNYSSDWQYGYKEAIETLKPLYPEADHVYADINLGRPYIYFLFYLKIDPNLYHNTAQVKKDKFYFLDVQGFDKIKFIESIDSQVLRGKVVYISTSEPPLYLETIKQIHDLGGKNVLYISKNEF